MPDWEAERLYKEGIKAFKSDDLITAGESLFKAVGIDDQYHQAWNALGVTFSKRGEYECADTYFRNALLITPENETYQKNLQKNLLKIKPVSVPEPKEEHKIPVSPRKTPFFIIGFAVVAIIAGLIILSFVASIILGSAIIGADRNIVPSPVPTLIPPPSVGPTIIQTPVPTAIDSVIVTPAPSQTAITPSSTLEVFTPSATISQETPGTAPCYCNADSYNCADFSCRSDAQKCFDYCKSIGKGDIHMLDKYKNGNVCDSQRNC